MFFDFDARMESLRSVSWQHGHLGLCEDAPCVDFCRDEVYGTACFCIARRERELRCAGSFVFGEQGRMDVHHAVHICADGGFFENAHEAGENDDVCSCALEVVENFLLRRIAKSAGMSAWIDIERRQASLASKFEEVGMFLIADGGDDVCIEGAALHGTDDGAEVGAFP